MPKTNLVPPAGYVIEVPGGGYRVAATVPVRVRFPTPTREGSSTYEVNPLRGDEGYISLDH